MKDKIISFILILLTVAILGAIAIFGYVAYLEITGNDITSIDFVGYGDILGIGKDKKEEDIIGVLKEFYRGDKLINLNSFGYKFYVRFWNFIYPLRYVFHLGISLLKKIYHLFKK